MQRFLSFFVVVSLVHGTSSFWYTRTKFEVNATMTCDLGNVLYYLPGTEKPESRPYEWCFSIELQEVDLFANPITKPQLFCTNEKTKSVVVTGWQNGDGFFNHYYEVEIWIRTSCSQESRDYNADYSFLFADFVPVPIKKEVSYNFALNLTDAYGYQGIIGEVVEN